MMVHHQGATLGADGSHAGRRPASAGTVNMNDVLPGPSSHTSFPPPPQSSSLHPSQLRHPSSAGPQQTIFGPALQQTLSQYRSADFLTPDIAATSLRRVKSDTRGHRQVRSEDIRYSTPSSPYNAPGMLVPPPSLAQQEFIRAAVTNRQYLHPTETVASIRQGHHRRASSGSRERPGIGGVTGWSSGASSARASPYPSPSASPRPGYGALPDVGLSMSMTAMRRTPSGTMMQVDMGMGGIGTMSMDTSSVPPHVAKVNVTTPSTADASQKRRKQPANFQCPVPGCGSTFTRHFNLKGEWAFMICAPASVSVADCALCRAPAVARGGEAVPVQVAGLREGLCAPARLQAARAAAPEHPPVPVRGLQEELCADGRAEPAP